MSKSLENIEKSVLEMYLNNPSLAREELESAGYNVDSLTKEGISIIKQHQFKLQVQNNKTILLELLNKAIGLIKQKVQHNREEAIVILNSYQVKVQFRNIELLTDQELNDILQDVDIVKLIEDLEKK